MSILDFLLMILAVFFQSLAITTIILKQQDNISFKKKVLFLLLMWIYCVASFIFIKNEFRFALCIIIISLIMYFILKIRDSKIVLYAFNSVVLLSFSEIVVSLLLVSIGIDSEMIVNNTYYNLIANILISMVAILLINIPIIKRIIYKVIGLFKKNKNLSRYLYIFLIIVYLIILKNGFEFLLRSNYYVNILFIISIVAILTIIIKNEFRYDQINDQNKQMLSYVTKYEKIITEQGKANHEFKNQLMVIRGYAQMNSPRLIEYLDSIVDDTRKTHSSYLISQLNNFPDGGIKGLLYYKLSVMEDEKIKYEISVESGVKTKLNLLTTDMYKNITKILGVLLDNAIDASKQSKNKKITISVIKEKSNIMFCICNTYKGKLDISKIGTGHTTKGKGHGYGLRLVNDIIYGNRNFKLENNLEDEYYVSRLYINIKNNNKKKK